MPKRVVDVRLINGQHGTAADVTARRQAISVMELAAPHFAHPQLPVSLAQAHAAPSFAFP